MLTLGISQIGNDLCSLNPRMFETRGNSHGGAAVSRPGQLAPRTGTGERAPLAVTPSIKSEESGGRWLQLCPFSIQDSSWERRLFFSQLSSHPHQPGLQEHMQAHTSVPQFPGPGQQEAQPGAETSPH